MGEFNKISILESLKRQKEWEKVVEQVKKVYAEELQSIIIKKIENILNDMKIPNDWSAYFGEYWFCDVKNSSYISFMVKKGAFKVVSFDVILEIDSWTFEVRIGNLEIYFYDPDSELVINAFDKIDFDKVISKYDEFSKIIKEIYIQ